MTERKGMPPGPAAKGQPKLTREQMRERDEKILRLFIGGASEREISRSSGTSPSRVHQILRREITRGNKHRELLRDQALDVYISRLDVLLRSCWTKAMAGDLKAIETARHVVEQQAKVVMGAPDIPAIEFDPDFDGDADELARYRRSLARRRGDY